MRGFLARFETVAAQLAASASGGPPAAPPQALSAPALALQWLQQAEPLPAGSYSPDRLQDCVGLPTGTAGGTIVALGTRRRVCNAVRLCTLGYMPSFELRQKRVSLQVWCSHGTAIQSRLRSEVPAHLRSVFACSLDAGWVKYESSGSTSLIKPRMCCQKLPANRCSF